MMKRGEGSDDEKIRSEAHGKENLVLNPYMRRYQNVDENIVAHPSKINPHQLIHEGGQFKQEYPTVSVNISSTAISSRPARFNFIANSISLCRECIGH
jgi:hypothetical protein